jgi:hypothetical protein
MSKRKYTKKSDYWNKFNKAAAKPQDLISSLEIGQEWEPEFGGEPIYTSDASYARTSSSGKTSARRNTTHYGPKKYKYSNIAGGLLPYEHSAEGIDVRDSIELCQKAYANVAIFRNTIDIMSEFANSDIHLEGGSKKSRDFIYKWFQHVKMWNLKDQFFREYYRSGNVFFYKVDGKLKIEDFKKINQIYGSLKPGQIPIKYILLNPYDIVLEKSTSYKDGKYKKILSEYELERLKNPKNDYDKEVYENLPQETKDDIKKGSWNSTGISILLEPEKLRYSFYKKQDYEPFAVPFGFAVLDDINFKLELKKIDQAICRTIENVILLITMGAAPDKGGINPNNIKAMQSLFQNESIGRALVADYTTKAEFVIPDINKVIGPDKYKIINEDIKEGLQNVIVGDERYANTQVKAKIFLERLKESRNAFINDFLQPEIKQICENMGFKNYPSATFQEVDIKDEVQFQRVVTRLMELGVLTPEEGIESIKTGIYPNSKDLDGAQEKFVESRQKGFYNPLVGGVPMIDEGDGGQEKQPPAEPGRPVGAKEGVEASENLFSRKEIQKTIHKIEKFRQSSMSSARKILKKKRLSKDHKSLIDSLVESVVISKEVEEWGGCVESCLKDFDKIADLPAMAEVLNLSVEHGLEVYPSAILYHSKK